MCFINILFRESILQYTYGSEMNITILTSTEPLNLLIDYQLQLRVTTGAELQVLPDNFGIFYFRLYHLLFLFHMVIELLYQEKGFASVGNDKQIYQTVNVMVSA